MRSEPGTYVLVLRSPGRERIRVGKWGELATEAGYYLYVGSAFGPGGVLSRVSRHCRGHKAKRWHIDYLREYAAVSAVWYIHSAVRYEHRWAEALRNLEHTVPISGFGCSDCRCDSHLFFVKQKKYLAPCNEVLAGKVQRWSCES